jgi:chaperonin GroES
MLEPLFDNIVVKCEEEKKAIGGIDLPDTVDPDAPQKGVITAVGPECIVKVDSVVIFRKYSPDLFTLDGVKYLLLSQKDIIALIK